MFIAEGLLDASLAENSQFVYSELRRTTPNHAELLRATPNWCRPCDAVPRACTPTRTATTTTDVASIPITYREGRDSSELQRGIWPICLLSAKIQDDRANLETSFDSRTTSS